MTHYLTERPAPTKASTFEPVCRTARTWTARVAPRPEAQHLPRSARKKVRGSPRTARLLVASGLALLPWLVVLATTLPPTAEAAHWRAAWVGLDALEAACLLTTGTLAARGDARHAPAAAATAALLVADAWFDTTTAPAGGELAAAVAMAVLVELPLAALCARLALRAHTPNTPKP
ncbi:hypothetical protein ACPA54_11465 [Uniformispora flossi]|uniref:hypothetical protein n=1 Tax=Uniformispora flossi TaxID=3390723 RepID=UPI003C308795